MKSGACKWGNGDAGWTGEAVVTLAFGSSRWEVNRSC